MGGDQGQNSVLLFRSSILQWDCAAILLRNFFFLLWLASSLLRGWNTPFYNYKLQYSILIQFAIITFCLPVTMVELRIANSSLAFKVSFTSSVRLSQLLPVFRYAVQLFCYAVQLCCYAVQLCCYVVQLCCYANPARSELDVRGLRTKAHSNSRWRRLCYCCRSLLSMEPVETMQKIPSICFWLPHMMEDCCFGVAKPQAFLW